MTSREDLIEEAERGNREREAREHRALFAANERNRLVEKAAKAILDVSDVQPDHPDGDHGYYAQTWRYAVQDAEAALSVFEQAHTPTDDEPVAYGIYGRVTGNLKYVQVMDEREVEEQSEFYDVVPLFRRTGQGKPSPVPDGNGHQWMSWDESGKDGTYCRTCGGWAGKVGNRPCEVTVQGEPSDEIRAESVREAKRYIDSIHRNGLVPLGTVLADLEAAAYRMSQGMTARGNVRVAAVREEGQGR